MPLIYRVVSVDAFRLSLPGKTWAVLARGETTSTGWSSPRLSPHGEQDDCLLFDFEAQPPGQNDGSQEVITPIVALGLMTPAKNIRGLIVRSTTNSVRTHTQVLSLDKDGRDEHDFLPYELDQPVELDSTEPTEDETRAGVAIAAAAAGTVCKDKTLLRIPLYPEFKHKGWKIYKRWRYSVTEIHYCYPQGVDDAVQQVLAHCLPIAVVAGVAGFAAGGPGGAVAAFEAALEGCATAEAAKLVSVNVRTREMKGAWKRL
jgi:hypothetical protein